MPDTDGESSREAIMHATYRALADRGYADLTTQAIADEAETSTALIHYHFDTKEELLVEFLSYLLDRFRESVDVDTEAPADQLQELSERFVDGPTDREAFHTAMVDLRAQAPHHEAYRGQLRINDAELTDVLADVLRAGIEDGSFNSVDPDRTASFLVSTIEGARTRWVVLGDESVLEEVHEELQAYLEARVFREGPER